MHVRSTDAAVRVAASLALVGGIIAGRGGDAAAAGERAGAPVAVAVAEPVYEDLQALSARGVVELPDLFVRPMLAFDVAAALERAAGQNPSVAADPTFRRAADAFSAEIRILRGGRPAARDRGLLSLADDENWLRAESLWHARAEGFADRGFVFTDSTRLGLRFSWIVWPGFHLFEELYLADIDNGRVFGDPLKPGTDLVIFQDRVYGALRTRYADIVLGRDRLAWGPGATGSLMLSRTGRPFTQLRLSRTFFDGLLHGVIVNGVLNQNERRYVAFHRLDWRIHRTLRLGLAEAVRYNAPGIEPLYLVGVIPYPIVERMLRRDNDDRLTDAATRNNVMWSLDGTWRAHPGLQIYGEILVDDIGVEDVDHPTRLGFQLGGYGVHELWGHEIRARLEWTRVWNYVYSTFYDADFEHEGEPLGYPLGPDSRLLHARGDWILGRTWSVNGTIERQDRGEGRLGAAWIPGDDRFAGKRASEFEGVVETQWHMTAGLRYVPSNFLEAAVALGPVWIRNADHVEGVTRRGMMGHASLGYRY